MAIGSVSFVRTNGNLNQVAIGTDHISGLIFDVASDIQLPSTIKLGDVNQIFSVNEAVALGIREYSGESESLLYGIAHFHISEFFRMKPDGSLYVMFADCSKDWEAIRTIQSIAQGNIRQLGLWTEKHLWRLGAENSPYSVDLISDIHHQADVLADEHQPLSVLLSANTTCADPTNNDKTIKLTQVPSCLGDNYRVTALIGQGRSVLIRQMQLANPNHSSVGCLGVALGCLAEAKTSESIAWVNQFNLDSKNMSDLEFGFGDITLTGDEDDFISTLPLEAISPRQLDELDNKGYVFPIRYPGRSGSYFSKDRTCSDGDYRTIARNRVIDKSRRMIRNALLSYLNSPLLVNPKTGYLAETEIKKYKNTVETILSSMEANGEISGFAVNIKTDQNVLLNDSLKITYALVPIGTAAQIVVEEGFSLTNS